MAVVVANVSRPVGVSVTVDRKDTGEIVPSISDSPTLVNAGASVRSFTTLASLTDTTLSSPQTGQILFYGSGSKWVNQELTGLDINSNGEVTFSNTGVTPGSYGSLLYNSAFTVDADGRLSNATQIYIPQINNFAWSSSNDTIVITLSDLTTNYTYTAPIGAFSNLHATNATFSNATIASNTYLVFGSANDLSIVYDSFFERATITSGGNNSLYIAANSLFITSSDRTRNSIVIDNGGVDLYYESDKKIETVNTGVTIYGDLLTTNVISATSFSGNGSGVTSVDAESLQGNSAADLLNWNNFTNLPSPNVSLIVNGDVQGVATGELANLASDASLTLSLELTDTGVVSNTYGSSTRIPVFAVDVDGRITSANNVDVASIANVYFSNGSLVIETSDGSTYNTPIDLSTFDTDDVTEGSNNLYYTISRANTAISNWIDTNLANTTSLDEGDNLYYTVARANAAIDSRVTESFVSALGADAQTVNGNTAADLLSWNNFTDVPSPSINLNANGDVQGTATASLSSLGSNADLSIALELTDTGVTANSYGNTIHVPTFTVDADGRLTDANSIALPSPNITVTLQGSVAGSANATLTNLQGNVELVISTEHPNTGVVEGTYGNTSHIPVIQVNSEGLVIAADTEELTFNNLANTPSPNVSITLSGDANGSATGELTNLGSDVSLSLSLELTDTGVTPNTYGSASEVPILTIDVDGRVTNALTVSVAGVSNVTWTSSNNTLDIDTADGNTFSAVIDEFNDLVIQGNLTVSGTTTTVNTEEINLADNIINLNSNLDGNTAPSQDSGISINRGSEADKTLVWNEAGDYWSVGSESFKAGSLEGTLPWSNVSSTPSPNVSISVTGDVEGSATAELTNLESDASLSLSLELSNTGVSPGAYGNASSVPIITVDADGRVTNASTTAVAGVSNVVYTEANTTLNVQTSDGSSYKVDLTRRDQLEFIDPANENNEDYGSPIINTEFRELNNETINLGTTIVADANGSFGAMSEYKLFMTNSNNDFHTTTLQIVGTSDGNVYENEYATMFNNEPICTFAYTATPSGNGYTVTVQATTTQSNVTLRTLNTRFGSFGNYLPSEPS